jgi:hypothetical protein
LTHGKIHTSLYDLAFAAAAGGRFREAGSYFDRARAEAARVGDLEVADGVLLDFSSLLMEMEQPGPASVLLKQRDAKVEDVEDTAFLQVLMGQPRPA